MTAAVSRKGLGLETPAIYRVCVQGRLDRNWSDRLSGMSIINSRVSESPPTTILEGYLAAQGGSFRCFEHARRFASTASEGRVAGTPGNRKDPSRLRAPHTKPLIDLHRRRFERGDETGAGHRGVCGQDTQGYKWPYRPIPVNNNQQMFK
jgi:hypothetical protein